MTDKTEATQELSRAEFADYLRALADQFEAEGDAEVSVGNKTVTLRPAETVTTEVAIGERSAMLRGDKETLRLEASWSAEREETD